MIFRSTMPEESYGLMCWYGDDGIAVLVNWSDDGRVVGMVRHNPDNDTWEVRMRLTRWRAFRARRSGGWPLQSEGEGLFRAWYRLPNREDQRAAVMKIENFFWPAFDIVWCGPERENKS